MSDTSKTENIIKTLNEGTEEEKSELLESLRDSENTSLVVPLVDILEQEKSGAIKDRILLVLNHLVALSQFKDAGRMLRSPDPAVRNGIVEIIKHHELPIIRFLDKLADDEDKDVRKFVIDALSQEKSEEAMVIIRKRLLDDDINIRYTAIEYLGNFKDSQSVSHIEEALLNGTHPMVLCSALEALGKIGSSPRQGEILEKFNKPGADPLMTFPMLKYLGAFGNTASFSYMEKLLDAEIPIYTKEIVDSIESIFKRIGATQLPDSIIEKLGRLIEKTDNNIDKYAIVKLINRSGGNKEEQLIKMREMLEGTDEMLQLCAIEIMGDIGGEEEIEILEELAENTESDELLEALGDAVSRIEERLGEEMMEEE